ncbi:MAG: S8 family serine peptidase, partial [Gammaproteobacteria bacterium]
ILTTVPHQAYDFMSGSSFATAHIAGLVALLLQQNPGWHLADIKPLLIEGLHSAVDQLTADRSSD